MGIDNFFPKRKASSLVSGAGGEGGSGPSTRGSGEYGSVPSGGGGSSSGGTGATTPTRQQQPRKRFRRRGPGLLTSDTELQKRLNALMRPIKSEQVLLSLERGNSASLREEDTALDSVEIPFDRKVLESLPEKEKETEDRTTSTGPPGTSAADTSTPPRSHTTLLSTLGINAAVATEGEKGPNGAKSKSLLSLTSPPPRRSENTEGDAGSRATRHSQGLAQQQPQPQKSQQPHQLRAKSKVGPTAACLPAFLRRKISGRAQIVRLLRKRHFRAYRRLLYDMPKHDGDGKDDEDLLPEDEEEEEDDERHRALDMLLGAAEVMKKEEGEMPSSKATT